MRQKVLDFLKENPDCDIGLLYDSLPVEAAWLVGTEKTAIQARTEDIRMSMEANDGEFDTNLSKLLRQMIEENEIVEAASNRFSLVGA